MPGTYIFKLKFRTPNFQYWYAIRKGRTIHDRCGREYDHCWRSNHTTNGAYIIIQSGNCFVLRRRRLLGHMTWFSVGYGLQYIGLEAVRGTRYRVDLSAATWMRGVTVAGALASVVQDQQRRYFGPLSRCFRPQRRSETHAYFPSSW